MNYNTTVDQAEIKNAHLYLNYEYYDTGVMGYRHDEIIIPIERIMVLIYHVGPKGGDHGWGIQSNENKTLADFGKKHTQLRDNLIKMFGEKKILVQKIQGTGSGPCY